MRLILPALLAGLAVLPAAANTRHCPNLSHYDVSHMSFRGGPLDLAIKRLLDGTAWRAEFTGPATDIRLSLIGVSGPMDMVLDRMIERASEAEVVESVRAVQDSSECVVRVSVTTRRPTQSTLVEPVAQKEIDEINLRASEPGWPEGERGHAAAQQHTLPAGQKLSVALANYVKAHGWSLRWSIPDDFLIDVPIPIPQGDMVAGVLHVVRAYQAAGAMRTVRPRFAEPNKVVVIESTGDQL